MVIKEYQLHMLTAHQINNTGCPDDRCPKTRIHISKSVHYTDIQFALIQRTHSSFFFLTTTYLSKFQCWHPWWHDKYQNNIQPLSTCLEPCCGLLYKIQGAWKMDQQRTANCLASQVTIFNLTGLVLWHYVKNILN